MPHCTPAALHLQQWVLPDLFYDVFSPSTIMPEGLKNHILISFEHVTFWGCRTLPSKFFCLRTSYIVWRITFNKTPIPSDYRMKGCIAGDHAAVTLHHYKVDILAALFTPERLDRVRWFCVHYQLLPSCFWIAIMNVAIPTIPRPIISDSKGIICVCTFSITWRAQSTIIKERIVIFIASHCWMITKQVSSAQKRDRTRTLK